MIGHVQGQTSDIFPPTVLSSTSLHVPEVLITSIAPPSNREDGRTEVCEISMTDPLSSICRLFQLTKVGVGIVQGELGTGTKVCELASLNRCSLEEFSLAA
jgi:hypothetical protein